MIDYEPKIKVALLQSSPEARLKLEGSFFLPNGQATGGELTVHAAEGRVILSDARGREICRERDIHLEPDGRTNAFFTVLDVKIGIDFHWQRNQELSFRGALHLTAQDHKTFNLINVIALEDYRHLV